jgi:hypothetical protein
MRKARATALLITERIASVQDGLFDPLSCATVIWYARPFTQAKGYPAIPERFAKFSSPLYQKAHDRLVRQRNVFEAHMDTAATEVFLIRKEAPISAGDSRLEVCSDSHFVVTDVFVPRAFARVVELCDFQLERLVAHIAELKGRLFP